MSASEPNAAAQLPRRLSIPVDPDRDHFIGDADARIKLVEYGSYSCEHCHAAHEVIADLRDRFGEDMMYVFRQLPIRGSDTARPAAELAEFAGGVGNQFWPVHDELMRRGPDFADTDLDAIAAQFHLAPDDPELQDVRRMASDRVDEDRKTARESGARATPTFYINGRRYEGPWDANALTEAMFGSLAHRVQSAALEFVRWGPSAGLLLLVASIAAVLFVNSPVGPSFEKFWHTLAGFSFGGLNFNLPLLEWINNGLLAIFFLVVGLEIKKEFTVGHLATRRSAALPIAASVGGMVVPALIYLAFMAGTPWQHGWGIPIATDTAFAIALIVLLGDRVPVELRVFLTAAVIVDDLAAIAVVALFYSEQIHLSFIGLAVITIGAMIVLNRWNIYKPLPYAIGGIVLWVLLHEAGLHATLAGVIMALVTPTRPPGNLPALLAQAENILQDEMRRSGESVLRHGPSEPAMRGIDAVFERIESPADKLLRTIEPWSSYFVLPIFALANAGVLITSEAISGHPMLIIALTLGLFVGKPVGIVAFAMAAVKLGLATKPPEYSWRQMVGVGFFAGIGFTMSLFIAGQAFPDPGDFAAAKIAVFAASIISAAVGLLVLSKRRTVEDENGEDSEQLAECTAA